MTPLSTQAMQAEAVGVVPGRQAWPARSAEFRRLAGEFLRFGVVGTFGFVVDTTVLYAGLALGLGPWLGRALSYLVAASTTYALNRAWTFRGRGDPARPTRQWALFLAVNMVGFAANYGAYAILIAAIPLVAAHPVLGVAAGSIAGLAANFTLSRRIVFAAPGDGPPSRATSGDGPRGGAASGDDPRGGAA